MYSIALANSLTGVRLADVTKAVQDLRWTTRANAAGTSRTTLQLRTTDILNRPEWRSFTDLWSRALTVSWDDTLVTAGLVGSREFADSAGTLALSMVELEAMLKWRMITGVSWYDAAGKLTVTGKSKRGLIRALVQAGLNRGDSSFFWNFNVDLGADYSGGHSRTWHHYSLQTVDALINEVRDSDAGPDVHLEPEWRGGVLWWVLRTGSPRLSGATFEFNQSAPDSPVINPRLIEDGAKMTTGTFAIGNGQDEAMIVGLGDPADSSLGLTVSTPYRDQTITHKHVEEQAVADSLALADVEAHFYPTRLKRFSLRITDYANPGNLRLGSRVRVWNDANEFENEGWFDGYLIGLSGTLSSDVMDVEVMPL